MSRVYKSAKFSLVGSRRPIRLKFAPPPLISERSALKKFDGAATSFSIISKQKFTP